MESLEPLRVSILGASLGPGNMGVNCLAAGAITCVLGQNPQADISFFDYDKEPSIQRLKLHGREVLIPLVNIRFSKKFYLANNIALLILLAIGSKLVPYRRLRDWLIASNRCLAYLRDADVVISLAGGDSFTDMYGLPRLLYVSLPQILAILMGKRLVLFPQTVGPFRRKLSQTIARYILRHAARVYSRDHDSFGALSALVDWKQTPWEFCYDIGFVVEPAPPAHLDIIGLDRSASDPRPLVGVNVSGLLLAGGYNHKNMFGLRVDYRELVEELVELLIHEKGAAVVLVPHVFGDSQESDATASSQIFDSLHQQYEGRLGLLRGVYDQGEIKHIIGNCDFFVGSRMHACVAAVSQHVPAVCIAYSNKFMGVMDTVGIGAAVADARRLSKQEIIDLVGKSFDQRDLIRENLVRRMGEVRRSVLSLFHTGSGVVEQPANPEPVGLLPNS